MWKDAYYATAMQKIENALESKKRGLVQSNIWDSHFKVHWLQLNSTLNCLCVWNLQHSLDTYPEYWCESAFSGSSCEACHRSNRVSSFQVILSGSAYDHQTCALLPPPPHHPPTFNLGRFCQQRSQLYHSLHHFKFHLMNSVQHQLILLGYPESDSDTQTAPSLQQAKDESRIRVSCIQQLISNERWISQQWHSYEALLNATHGYTAKD